MALEKFCLCCKLRNGVIILGAFCIILDLIVLAVTVSSDIFFDRIQKNIIYGAFGIDNDITNENNSIPDFCPTPFFWFFVFSGAVDILLCILLVVGAVKSNHFLMLPWIIVRGIGMIPFALATAVFLIAGLPIYGPVYIWWCVCSAYQKMQEVPYDKFNSLLLSNVDNTKNRDKEISC